MIKRGLRLFAFIVLGTGSYYCINLIYTKASQHQRVIITGIDNLNQQTINDITTYCEQNASLHHYNSWTKDLKQRFPVIKSIKIKKDFPIVLNVFLEPHACKALLNNDTCIAPDGSSYPLTYFERNLLTNSPKLTVEATNKIEEISQFIANLDQKIIEEYKINWHSPYEIYLETHDQTYALLIQADTPPSKKIQNIARRIAQEEAQKKYLILDARFKDQIVLFKNRGKINGQGIFR